jgi:hypothetical protein
MFQRAERDHDGIPTILEEVAGGIDDDAVCVKLAE